MSMEKVNVAIVEALVEALQSEESPSYECIIDLALASFGEEDDLNRKDIKKHLKALMNLKLVVKGESGALLLKADSIQNEHEAEVSSVDNLIRQTVYENASTPSL